MKTIFALSLSLFLSLGCFLTWQTLSDPLVAQVPFDTDEADHANAGVELYSALGSGSSQKIARAIFRQSFYPPVHSFSVAAAYAVFGPSWWSSRLPSTLLFFLSVALFAATAAIIAGDGRSELRFSRVAAAAAAAGLLVSSPLCTVYSSLCMLEMPGLCGFAVLIWALSGYHRSRGRRRLKAAAGLALLAMAVFLTKYNYGIVLCPALVLALFFGREAGASETRRHSVDTLSAIVAALTMIVVTIAWLAAANWDSFRHFLIGHPHYRPILSLEHILFYPRAWLFDYSPNPIVGVCVLLLAVVAVRQRWHNAAVRAAAFAVLIGSVVHFISTTDEVRHFLIPAAGLWLLAGTGAGVFVSDLSPKFRFDAPRRRRVIPAFFIVLFVSAIASLPERRARLHDALEGKPEYGKLFEQIFQRLPAGSPVIINGTSDTLSLEAFRWAAAARWGRPYTAVNIDAYPLRGSRYERQRLRARNVDASGQGELTAEPSFPDVIKKGTYSYAINLTKPKGGSSRFRESARRFLDAVDHFPSMEVTAGDRRAQIFMLRPLLPGPRLSEGSGL